MDWLGIIALSLLLITGWYLIAKSVGYLLLIWFDDAKFFLEYLQLFGLDKKIPHINNYLKSKEQGNSQSYLDYLGVVKDNFLTRLVLCEKCLSAWLSILSWMAILMWIFFILSFKIIYILPLVPILIFSTANQSLIEYKKLK
jgi:hypothetical protein